MRYGEFVSKKFEKIESAKNYFIKKGVSLSYLVFFK